jgi:hypothetical protein
MTDQTDNGGVTLADVSKALDLVNMLLNQLTIPATRAQEFAVAGKVLAELKAFVDSKVTPQQTTPEGAENSNQADVEPPAE